MTKLHPPNSQNDAIDIGNRIKSTRMLSGHTRRSFALYSGISIATLRFWEEPPAGRHGLTIKGAERLVSAFNACGIYCTRDWLLYGKGYGAKLINSPVSLLVETEEQNLWDEEEAILKDIESFKENNPNPIVAMVNDENMLPFFAYGDYVGGNKKYSEEINQLLGLNCIVEVNDHIMIRKLISGDSQDTFSLISLNHDQSLDKSVILNVKLKLAAEVVFHRRRGCSRSK